MVPFADSEELIRNSGLPSEALIQIGTEHRLADPESLKAMLETMERVSAPEIPAIVHEAGVPRQFGVGILMVITTMYAVLFAVLRASDPVTFVIITLFFTAVGLGEMLLFKRQRPQRASIIMGAVFLPSVVTIDDAVHNRRLWAPDDINAMIFGPLLGYIAGYAIAFLVIHKLKSLRDKYRRRK